MRLDSPCSGHLRLPDWQSASFLDWPSFWNAHFLRVARPCVSVHKSPYWSVEWCFPLRATAAVVSHFQSERCQVFFDSSSALTLCVVLIVPKASGTRLDFEGLCLNVGQHVISTTICCRQHPQYFCGTLPTSTSTSHPIHPSIHESLSTHAALKSRGRKFKPWLGLTSIQIKRGNRERERERERVRDNRKREREREMAPSSRMHVCTRMHKNSLAPEALPC